MRHDVALSLPCWLSQFRKAKLRQPRQSNVRTQQKEILIRPISFLYYEDRKSGIIKSEFKTIFCLIVSNLLLTPRRQSCQASKLNQLLRAKPGGRILVTFFHFIQLFTYQNTIYPDFFMNQKTKDIVILLELFLFFCQTLIMICNILPD